MLNSTSALSSPDWFLERFHIETGTFTLIRTTRPVLHETAFHDGRSDLKINPDIIHVSIEEALEWLHAQTTSTPHRLIAHTSFCGSTLLARAIDVPSHVIAYREPQVLIDLANLKASAQGLYAQENMWPDLLTFVLKQFQKSWLPSQTTVIKPSNWANTLLPDIVRLKTPTTLLFMSMDIEAYIIANMRGGKARLKFSLDLLNHLLAHQNRYVTYAETIQSMDVTPLQKTLCLLALGHAIQQQIFLDSEALNPKGCQWFTKSDLVGNPDSMVQMVAKHFELPVPLPELTANTAITLQYNSKMDGDEFFNRESERNMNATLRHAYSTDINVAIDWFETHFPEIMKQRRDITRFAGSA